MIQRSPIRDNLVNHWISVRWQPARDLHALSCLASAYDSGLRGDGVEREHRQPSHGERRPVAGDDRHEVRLCELGGHQEGGEVGAGALDHALDRADLRRGLAQRRGPARLQSG